MLDDDLQADVHDNPSKIFVFAFDQDDLNSLGTASTFNRQGWKFVRQPIPTDAAEIGMERNPDLIWDPVNGLVQIPGLESNTMI